MFQKLNKIKLLFLTFIIALICTGCGVYVTTQNSGQEGNQESAYKEEATVETVTEAVSESVESSAETESITEEPEAQIETEAEAWQEESDTKPESEIEQENQEALEEKDNAEAESDSDEAVTAQIDENGTYTSKEDVAEYIHTYNRLPDNFITKKEAKQLGWSGGGLEEFAPGKCIGGDYFGNYEELLPVKKGRKYTECDIDTLGKSKRGAKRIIFSNDGLIYYTADHYESFELLYGEE